MKKRKILLWLIVVLITLIRYYFELPPINLSSPLFWYFIFTSCIIILIALVIQNGSDVIINKKLDLNIFKVEVEIKLTNH